VKDGQEILRNRREKLRQHSQLRQEPGEGRLTPGHVPESSVIVGGGVGQPCFVCEEPITAEVSQDTTQYGCLCGHPHWVHARCFTTLEAARHPTGRDLIEEQRHTDARRSDG
jgi:hypothetical protein